MYVRHAKELNNSRKCMFGSYTLHDSTQANNRSRDGRQSQHGNLRSFNVVLTIFLGNIIYAEHYLYFHLMDIL